MNNEETIVMKPQTDNKAEQAQNVETMEKKSNKGKKVAATAAAAVMGGVVGSGATYAATTMLHDKEAEEQKPEDEAQTTEESVVAAAEEPQKEQQTEAPKEEEVAVKLDAAESAEPDYTGAHHARLLRAPRHHAVHGVSPSACGQELHHQRQPALHRRPPQRAAPPLSHVREVQVEFRDAQGCHRQAHSRCRQGYIFRE